MNGIYNNLKLKANWRPSRSTSDPDHEQKYDDGVDSNNREAYLIMRKQNVSEGGGEG